MARYRTQKRADNLVELGDIYSGSDRVISRTNAPDDDACAIIVFTHDRAHRVVMRDYWKDEIIRALDLGGFEFRRFTTLVLRPMRGQVEWATGINCAELLFTQRYDTEELLAQINAHAVNLRALEVRWIDRWARQTAIYCRIELPEWAHAEVVERKIADVMKAESWFVEEESHRWSPPRNFSSIRELKCTSSASRDAS